MSFFINKKNQQDIYENYYKSIEKLQNNPEYIENELQIKIIKKIIIEHSDVPRRIDR